MDRAHWKRELQEAEQDLDAARGRTATNAAARRLQRARAELKRLEGLRAAVVAVPVGLRSRTFAPVFQDDGRVQLWSVDAEQEIDSVVLSTGAYGEAVAAAARPMRISEGPGPLTTAPHIGRVRYST